MVRVNINLGNKTFYTILAIALVLIVAGIVIAVNPTTKPNPGHASNEVMVNIGGADKTLQAAIDAGDFSGGGNLQCIEISDDNCGTSTPGCNTADYKKELLGVTGDAVCASVDPAYQCVDAGDTGAGYGITCVTAYSGNNCGDDFVVCCK